MKTFLKYAILIIAAFTVSMLLDTPNMILAILFGISYAILWDIFIGD